MKSVLYDLYYGNIDPESFYEPMIKEHRNFIRRKFNSLDMLGEELNKNDPLLKKAFDKVLDFAFVDAHWDTSNAFMQGFSLGVRMITEAYTIELSAKEK